jgi:hypothetical protein
LEIGGGVAVALAGVGWVAGVGAGVCAGGVAGAGGDACAKGDSSNGVSQVGQGTVMPIPSAGNSTD